MSTYLPEWHRGTTRDSATRETPHYQDEHGSISSGRASIPDGGFLPEARTMEVSVPSTDIGVPAALYQSMGLKVADPFDGKPMITLGSARKLN